MIKLYPNEKGEYKLISCDRDEEVIFYDKNGEIINENDFDIDIILEGYNE